MIKKSMLILPILLSSLYANDNKMLYLMGEWDLKLKDKNTEERVKINLNEFHKKNRIIGSSDRLGKVACQKNRDFNFVELMKAVAVSGNKTDMYNYICYFFDEGEVEPSSLIFIESNSKNTLKGIYYPDNFKKVVNIRLADILNSSEKIVVNGVKSDLDVSKEINYLNRIVDKSVKFKNSRYGKIIHSDKIKIAKEFLDFNFASYITYYEDSNSQKIVITQPILEFKKNISSTEMKNLSLDDKKAIFDIIYGFYMDNLFYTDIKNDKKFEKKFKYFTKDAEEILKNKPFKKLFNKGEKLKLGYFKSAFDKDGKYINTEEIKLKSFNHFFKAEKFHNSFIESLFGEQK